MIEKICTFGSLHHQLKLQGLKLNDDADASFFEKMLLNVEYLYMYDYITKTEFIKSRKRIFKDLEKYITKIEE